MTQLKWDLPEERTYEVGVDRGVFYLDNAGVAWNGLISIQERSSGGEIGEYYMDGMKYAQTITAEDFEATLEAFSSPNNFSLCDGRKEVYSGLIVDNQKRKTFGLSYRTLIGDSVLGTTRGYKIHLVYNAIAAPTERSYKTIGDSVEMVTYSWDITTIPQYYDSQGLRPTAHLIVDSTKADPAKLAEFEAYIYGDHLNNARFPTMGTVWEIFNA